MFVAIAHPCEQGDIRNVDPIREVSVRKRLPQRVPRATCSVRVPNRASGDGNPRNRLTAPENCHATCCHPVGNNDASTSQLSLAIRSHQE
jgi:hypothetical protein